MRWGGSLTCSDSVTPEAFPAALRRAVDDFRFPLMRHWTVYDSIVHSRYVAVRLHTWQEKGKDKVKELLVRMGLSQRDCQADYCESRPHTGLADPSCPHGRLSRQNCPTGDQKLHSIMSHCGMP